MATVPIKLSNLQKNFGQVQALRGVDFSLLPGEFLSLLGPSGSGKTTLLRILAGFLKPTFGRVVIGGLDMTDFPPGRRDLCAVFRDTPLFPLRTVLQNVAYGMKFKGQRRSERKSLALRMLALADLEDAAKKRPGHLTPYQYKMAVLARALVLRPKVLLLDDPFAGLTEEERRRILAFLKALQQQWHFSIVYATTLLEEAMAVSHRMALLSCGRVEQEGTPEEIYHHPVSVAAARAMGPMNLLPATVAARKPGGFLAIDMDGLTLPAQTYGLPPSIGEDVMLCLRPEQIHLYDSPRPDCLLSGIITSLQEIGGRQLYAAALPTGQEILCDTSQAAQFSPGSRVFLCWETSQAVLLPLEDEVFPKAVLLDTAEKGVPVWAP